MIKRIILSSVAVIIFTANLFAADAPLKPFYLEPGTLGSWWHIGEVVTYRGAGQPMPADLVELHGTITDANDKVVAQVTAKREDFEAKGWTWTPPEPGFYEVEFVYIDGSGAKKEIARSYEMKAPAPAEKKAFKRTRMGFAVVPVGSVPPEKSVGQFGLANDHPTPEDVQLAKFIGFDLVRLTVPWGSMFTELKAAVEPVKGEYHWERLDKCVDLYTQAGFVINAQFLYTPVWASPCPEKVDKINICVREANAYAPKDMNDFTTFVELVVNRYKDRVRLWEVWNEPSVPGGSVFWSDTTENYVAMLKAGYTTIKKNQPEAEVWIGGLGPRAPYHAFYNRVLQLGGDKYFDVLSLHGSFNVPEEKFRAIEKANGVAPKPAIQGEWHAILQGNAQSSAVLSEQALSLKMMKDMLYQIKYGVGRIIMFELKNLVEKENLEYASQNKWFVHSSGLFRVRPQVEPRQPAVVLANFLDTVNRKAAFVKEFALADNAIAVLLNTGNGSVVAFWSEKAPLSVASVSPFATAGSVFKDWEGKKVSLEGKTLLVENRLYYLTAANAEAIAKAPVADNLISPRAQSRSAVNVPKGTLVRGALFAAVDATATVADAAWLQNDWKLTTLNKSVHDEKFSVRAAAGTGEMGLDLVVEVTDKTHAQKEPSSALWNGDSLQVAIDCEGGGFTGGNSEFVCALSATGPVAWKNIAADPRGDIPQKWSPANGPAKFVEQKIARDGDTTRYQIRIPWSEIYPLANDPSKPLRISFAVNNNNGAGRAEYLEWGGGITKDKDPATYGVLQVAPASK